MRQEVVSINPINVLSLFDGISCGMVALERANISVNRYVAYEIEPHAIQISKKNYPQIEHYGDVTTADFKNYAGFDLLIGRPPCQSLSIVQSKTRKHLEGKSKLFFEYVRALNEGKPKYFLFENVATMNKESKQIISHCLGCEPILINSNNFSAQDRARLYWTNIPVELPINHVCKDTLKNILQDESEVHEKYYYDAPLFNIDMSKQVCAMLDLGNYEMLNRVLNPEFKCHTLTCVSGGHQQKKVLVNGRARKLTPLEYERLQTLPDNYTEGVSGGARYSAIGNGWTVNVISYILKGINQEESNESNH